jgi:hypothetical protein
MCWYEFHNYMNLNDIFLHLASMKRQHLPSPCPLPKGESSKPFSPREQGWDEGGF